MNKKIIVTGASGHIGFHVAKQLLELNYPVTLLIRKENQNTRELKAKGAQIEFADLLDPNSYRTTLLNADVLFHLASENSTDTSDEGRVILNTFELTKKVIDEAIAQHVKTIIYTSSVVVLGRSPDKNILITENDSAKVLESPYVKGKFLAEQYCNEIISKDPSIDIRRIYPSWVVGPNDTALTPPHKVIKDYLAKGQKFYFSGGISLTSVEEVAAAHINAWLKGKPHQKYTAGGNNITFQEFYYTLAKLSGKKKPFLFLPKWFIYYASIASKLVLGKKSKVDPAYVDSVIGNYSWYDSSKTINELGYSIPSLNSILEKAILENKKKELGVNKLVLKNDPAIVKTEFASDDILLITGFPGWLGNRMLDIFMNGDTFGKNAINRKIRLLVQPGFKDLISLPSNFEIVYGDITKKETLGSALSGVKTIYHLAGVIYPKNISAYYKVNEEGTKNLVDAAIESGIRRILFMSTDSVCGYGRKERFFTDQTPQHPYKNYGRSKYMAEKYILDKTAEGKIDGTSLRGFWFFGPFMPERNMNFFNMFFWKRQIVFGNGKNVRSISHVDNIIQAFIKAEKRKETFGKWYWIGNKTNDHTVDHIYETVASGLGVKYNPFYIPRWVCEIFSIFDTMISWFGKINASIHAAGKFHKDIAGEISAAEKDFDYKPDIGFEEIKIELKNLFKK